MIFSHAAYGINPAGIDGRAISGASINVIQYAAEDSSSVIKYIAALYNATTNVLLDSLSSGATNTVQFANVPITDVEKVGTSVPRGYSLEQNYPNPFNPSTIIRFGIANPDNVSLTVYDILGRSIATLVDQRLSPGAYQVSWNSKVASGVYFYRLHSGSYSETKKMIALEGSGHGAAASHIAILATVNGDAGEVLQSPLRKMQSGAAYTLRLYTVTGVTVPQVVSRLISIPNFSRDTTIFLYSPRAGAHVYPDSTQQIIRGFGAANIVGWRPDMTSGQIQTAFGTGPDQVGFSIMRLRIPPDPAQFSINIPSAQAATSMGVTLIATPWTPPASMKSNTNTVGGTLNTGSYAAFAAHLKAFADTMASYGAPIYALSVQNEPDASVTYESCSWNGTQFLNFMKNNAAAVGTPVFMPESESFTHSYSDPTLNDTAAAANVAFVGGHLYGNTNLNYPLALSKGKELWMTEYLVLDTTWSAVLGTAKNINDCMNAQMSAYIWWYIVRYYGPISETGSLPMKRGYVMSQYARFVRPGYHRIKVDANPQSNIYVTAYKNGSKVVIVALNMGSSSVSQTFVISHSNGAVFTPYVTSNSKNCVEGFLIPASGPAFTVVLEASSVTTFVSD